jgi:hypothetical protein
VTAREHQEAGTYSGTTSGKYIQVGQAEEPTDRGKGSASYKDPSISDFPVRFSAKRR